MPGLKAGPTLYDLALSPEALDAGDPLRNRRDLFALAEGVIYLDGNSLGPLTYAAQARASLVVTEQWGNSLIRAWNTHDWMRLPTRVGARIARLIGAEPDHVVVGDSTPVALFKLLASALQLRPLRPTILTEDSNFPRSLEQPRRLSML